MTQALNREPLLRALHDAGVRHIIMGGFAVNAHGVIRPSNDLDIVPDPTRALGEARGTPPPVGRPPRGPRLETRLGDVDVMQWVAGIETEPAYEALAAGSIEGELDISWR